MNSAAKQFDIEQQSSLLFEENEIPFDDADWQQLTAIVNKSKYQYIIGGDSSEKHAVWVSRYFNDVESPEALNTFSRQVEAIVMSPKMRAFYRQFTGTDKLCLRRCQANRLEKGDFIGVHKDQDSSPDYMATIVFHLSDDYEGGRFVTGDGHTYRPNKRMALVNNCSISHQVTVVERGERLTLACFLSTSFEPTKKKRAEFTIAEEALK